MFFSIIGLSAANLLYLVLHVTNSGSFPRPLSAAEERKYLELLKTGDETAKNVLIERNLRLVAHIIKKYYANARDQDDLISIGTIGLIKAVSTFDGDKGTRLATYAARCIENEMLSQWSKRSSGWNSPSFLRKMGPVLQRFRKHDHNGEAYTRRCGLRSPVYSPFSVATPPLSG